MSHVKNSVLALLFLAAPLWADVSKEDIRKLVSAGISEDVVLLFIRANGPVERMTSDDLVQLRATGASDRVLSAVLGSAQAGPAPAVQLTPQAPPQDETPPPVLPQTTLADYTTTDTSPYATYYSGLPYDYYAPAYSYYYSPWFGACSPWWGCGFSTFGFRCGFGFPCFNACFSPWWGGCFGSFGICCPSFGFCCHPFGFCGRPFGSFFPGSSFRFGFRQPGTFRSSFAASAFVIASHQQALMVRQQAGFRNGALGTRAGVTMGQASARGFETRAAAPSMSGPAWSSRVFALPRSTMTRSYNYAPSYSRWNSWRPQSFSGGNSWRPSPVPHSSGFSWGHGGGGGSFGGGGGGHGGGHGGHGR